MHLFVYLCTCLFGVPGPQDPAALYGLSAGPRCGRVAAPCCIPECGQRESWGVRQGDSFEESQTALCPQTHALQVLGWQWEELGAMGSAWLVEWRLLAALCALKGTAEPVCAPGDFRGLGSDARQPAHCRVGRVGFGALLWERGAAASHGNEDPEICLSQHYGLRVGEPVLS